MCPDSSGKFKGIAISRVPWHVSQEHDSLPNLSSQWFCKGEACKSCDCPKSLCDEARCEKPCRRCDRDGMKEDGKWRNEWRNEGDTQDIPRTWLYPTD